MGFWSLFLVASAPIVQLLLIGLLGAYLASGYSNLLLATARRDMNKIVFTVFTPSLMLASLAKTVTLEEIISWWFMPVNLGITFLIGSILGWIIVRMFRPPKHLEGLMIATCSAGNMGNLLWIVIPGICEEEGSPFGSDRIPSAHGLASLSMAIGGFYIWTHSYSLMRNAAKIFHGSQMDCHGLIEAQEKDLYTGEVANQENIISPSIKLGQQTEENQIEIPLLSSGNLHVKVVNFCDKTKEALHTIAEELVSPPTVASIIGFIVGATPWLKSLFIGSTAPMKVVEDSVQLLGDGTIPCITLILGGNLTQGLRKSVIKNGEILAIICIRYVILPVFGIAVVKAAYKLGLVPYDPLYHYVLMIQFSVPPAMNIGTMTQLCDVGQDECSVIFLWTYVVATVAVTVWSTIFMWILS
ncbi:protein PIN-LIKES 7-like [Canna indica]|uniref:Protein PIN-LIKES 7-like n=1 Tax=Canna indica TaxID=4628 RepID=A0AAQ3QEC6_9LILI|nr:protein PIN-LIKES 7-like [Canna indica]